MKKMKLAFRRFLLLNKRLLKKPAFVAILLLIPLLVGAFSVIAGSQDSGLITVAIGKVDNQDPIAVEITDFLSGSPSLMQFIDCKSADEALHLVTVGKADAAWIFNDNLEKRIEKFTDIPNKRNAFIKVVERESSVLLQISHEKLYSAIFPYLSYEKYEDFIAHNVVELSDIPRDKLQAYYDSYIPEGTNLFAVLNADSDVDEENAQNAHYLLSPLRGLLAVVLLIGGFSVSMYYMQDKKDGRFDFMKRGKRAAFAIYYHLTAVLDLAVVTVVAIYLMGIGVSPLREILVMFLYAVMIVGFAHLLALLCRKIGIFGALIPVVSMVSIAVCPIFFNLVKLPLLQFLLPPYYYLQAMYDNTYILYMLIYIAAVYGIGGILYFVKEK